MRSKLYDKLHGNYMLKIKHELPRSELARLSTYKKKAMSEELIINPCGANYMINYMAITC